MAKYDYGGGCPCGLYRECIPQCEYHVKTNTVCSCGPHDCNCDRGKKDMKDSGDFGFTMVSEEDFQSPNDTRAEQLRDMIMPLLNNLKTNPTKDMIKWNGPDRVKKIDEFIKKMNKLVDG